MDLESMTILDLCYVLAAETPAWVDKAVEESLEGTIQSSVGLWLSNLRMEKRLHSWPFPGEIKGDLRKLLDKSNATVELARASLINLINKQRSLLQGRKDPTT